MKYRESIVWGEDGTWEDKEEGSEPYHIVQKWEGEGGYDEMKRIEEWQGQNWKGWDVLSDEVLEWTKGKEELEEWTPEEIICQWTWEQWGEASLEDEAAWEEEKKKLLREHEEAAWDHQYQEGVKEQWEKALERLNLKEGEVEDEEMGDISSLLAEEGGEGYYW